jgi:hypothetical protein
VKIPSCMVCYNPVVKLDQETEVVEICPSCGDKIALCRYHSGMLFNLRVHRCGDHLNRSMYIDQSRVVLKRTA